MVPNAGIATVMTGSLVPTQTFQGSSTNSINSTHLNPIVVTGGGQFFSGIAGDIGGTHTTDAYSFYWAGGSMSLTEMSGPTLYASLYDSQGDLLDTLGTLGLTGSTPIDLASGDYVLQLTSNSSDPPYDITFNEPIGGLSSGPSTVPEPCTMLLLGSGLIGLAAFRKKFKKA